MSTAGPSVDAPSLLEEGVCDAARAASAGEAAR